MTGGARQRLNHLSLAAPALIEFGDTFKIGPRCLVGFLGPPKFTKGAFPRSQNRGFGAPRMLLSEPRIDIFAKHLQGLNAGLAGN